MKIIKLLVVAIVAIFTFGTADAQVSIKARIGQRPAPRRHVVVRRPVHRRVVVHHPIHHRVVHHPITRRGHH